MARIFGTDGVRGVANKELNPILAFNLGKAACKVLKKDNAKPVFLIGKDTRISGDLLENALCAGIMSQGGDVIKAGVIPTPGVAVLIGKYGSDSGVVISASHNPYYDNGIKFFNSKGQKLSDDIEDEIQRVIENNDYSEDCTHDNIGRCTQIDDSYQIYVEHILSKFPKFNLNNKKIVLDCANGASFKSAETAFKKLGADIICINNTPNGININDNCGSTHLDALKNAVKENKADLGFAFDGDADRLLACDENGNEINGDMIMYIIAKYLKQQSKLKDDTIVITVMSNMGLKKALQKENINIVETAVGDRYILQEMLKCGYTLGGEQSGHIINSEINSTGDGLATAICLSLILSENECKFSSLFEDFVNYPQVLINVRTSPDKKTLYLTNDEVAKAMNELNQKYEGEGRILLRPSGTEPLVRVMIEGADIDEITKDANYLAQIIDRVSK